MDTNQSQKKTSQILRILLLFCCFLTFPVVIFESVQAAKPQSHELKVFVNEEQNKLYWPMDLPFYVRLAASPDEGSPSFLLDRVANTSELSKELNIQDGIRLEIPGNQFIRWVDYVSKDEIMLQFFADGDPPVSKVSLINAPVYSAGKETYFGFGLECSLESSDNISGVAEIYVSINNEPFNLYSKIIPIETEGNFAVSHYSVDNVGYAEKPKSVNFTVDLTPPESEYEIVGNFSENILPPGAKIELSANDNLSGVKTIKYNFDSQDSFYDYAGKNLSLEKLSDGNHTLYYYGVDNVDNRETIQTYSFYLDKISPLMEISVEGDLYSTKEGDFISPRSKLVLSASDNEIGVNYIEYAINDGDFIKYEKPFAAPPKSGGFTVAFRAADKLNNLSPNQTKSYIMDFEPPAGLFKITGIHYSKESVHWLTNSSKIVFDAEDKISGLNRIEYQISGKPVEAFKDFIQIKDAGQYLLRNWSVDNVNNRIENKAVLLIVDDVPPQIIETYSISPIDSVQGTEGKFVKVYPRFLSIFVAAIDANSGIKSIEYSINDKEAALYDSPLLFEREGSYHLSIKAVDNVDNVQKKEIDFIIRND